MPRRERNKFVRKNQVLELRIEDYAFGGKGIARIKSEEGSFVVFVPNTLPGQLVKAQISKSSKKYAEAKLIDVLEASKDEVALPFQDIPGAPYIQLPIELQHQYKKESTLSLFKRIGKVENIEDLFDEFISSPNVFHYRNKMEYGFSAIGYDRVNKTDADFFTLGFKRRGTWWMGDNLNKDSGLFDTQVEDSLKIIREYCEKTGLAPWHGPKREGFFRYFVVRKSYKTNELLFNLVTTSADLPKFDMPAFVSLLKDIFGDRLAGLLHTINDEVGDRTIATSGSIELITGKDKIVEELLGLNFEISMKSFFQTNPKSAEKLYTKVVDYALENKEAIDNTVVMDLFCGTGTIGQILASRSENAKIVGVDIVASAIEDAKENAKRNNIEGLQFYAADVGKFLYEHPQYQNKIKTIILDPARAGIAPKTLRKIIRLNADRMVYVSCNPATQARDTEELMNAGYKLKKISLVDQFPHTAHIETVVLFEK
ncbi:23S rRNA (uracil(1939)-C(5))-methyltransferase RlmD [Tenacibaculum finnmarkense]|uniref:23S rRNA (Uracil(1939)-C(5))-methyltransferase RlmD n=1 Tax=Tenacibaculum finnmarkense genomovar finnmarkense TaxID=1458503 RepID=A0AAP1REG2_9FLAO|nr:23S rRNA (uracil(1939)-C(5))-methyltransferase RlmD [Tenacibaculum finnmarkense]MBE7652391.1 23S rRNA (uracil(1939)-C(5))-methyltransferase RlmD [Tenacibaculum finnmarkense genomovar finnmarkense]MBE7694799.1 23S rRNA (uracil(1939)-C(5))-methyltransferase RlmD [Tenacibaculum finnmarkense genomovar finnmarkense]MCD8413563.1 23S rRNA (uracil(1939)-C(5))-methyltransferase RlmD [Tenacibaculum finnmarkense genomovar ulcerans]MCD8438805.1 23S rRNA (uracil(1939)-C(5))-methyltransferase RlmD [Tenaci